MPRTRRLLREEITYSHAKEREVNILHQLGYIDEQRRFFAHLYAYRDWMKSVVAHHLNLKSNASCYVPSPESWFRGSFNVCVPITVINWEKREQSGNRVILRFPLPYRVGEDFRPGNGDEKIQCEAGSYAWLQQNCVNVPIPRLYGFALSTGHAFTRVDCLPFLKRCIEFLRRWFRRCFHLPIPSNYAPHPSPTSFNRVTKSGYLLIECIENTQGSMLSNTWSVKRHDAALRRNFFRDFSRILLDISRIPLPRIGSFIIDSKGFLALSNRPLSMELHELENEGIPTGLTRDHTHSSVDSYVTDILGVHDSRLRMQPNAVNNVQDCGYQMSALAAMRTISPLFLCRNLRRGPFVFMLTDLHQSNIFVDDNWHITCLVDLEWACTRPVQMIEPPYWLTNQSVDEIDVEEFDKLRREFMDIMRVEETKLSSEAFLRDAKGTLLRTSDIMEQAWATGMFWYSLALSSPTGLFRLFYERIQPLMSEHCSNEIGEIMPFYWGKDVGKFVATKIADKRKYDEELQLAFAESSIEGSLCS